MTWTHQYQCDGVTSNPNHPGHPARLYTATISTPTELVPHLRPLCPRCVQTMDYVSSSQCPGLDAAELEVLAHAAEELGEAVAEIGKTLVHGLESSHSDQPLVTNRRRVAAELGHVLAAVDALVDLGVVTREAVNAARDDKTLRMGKWLHHIAIGDDGVARRKIP